MDEEVPIQEVEKPDGDEEAYTDKPPSEEQQRMIQKAHDNSGHHGKAGFLRLLRLGRCKPSVLRWVSKEFRFAVCESRPRPKAVMPTGVARSYRTNQVVGVDLFFIKDTKGVEFPVLNVICWGAGYQMVQRVQAA